MNLHCFAPSLLPMVLETQSDSLRPKCDGLLISIYFYSAIGKLDFDFLHTVGQQMLAVALRFAGSDISQLSNTAKIACVASFPILELAIAIGARNIANACNRCMAGYCAAFRTFAVPRAVRPQSPLGVLVWNIQVAGQVFCLFLLPKFQSERRTEVVAKEQIVAPEPNAVDRGLQQPSSYRSSQYAGALVILCALLLPLTERLGVWDHGPAGHFMRLTAVRSMSKSQRSRFQTANLSWGQLVEPPSEDSISVWSRVPIDAWSLSTLTHLSTPKLDFSWGSTQHLSQGYELQHSVRIILLGSSSRFTGARQQFSIETASATESLSKKFWLIFIHENINNALKNTSLEAKNCISERNGTRIQHSLHVSGCRATVNYVSEINRGVRN